jgi:energy-coupling factor transporter ATP-binding protein EcfA2
VVLHGVDLTLKRGEVKLLLGPSGAGKSSLALTLNGLIPHQMEGEIRGSVMVNGRSTQSADVAWLTSQVGMLFQDPEAQIATLTVEDEVAFGMENLRVPPSQMPQRIGEALHRVGLEGLESRATDALSGGQKQRLALARALARRPRLVLLDDALAAGDTHTEAEILRGLRGALAGRTAVIASHRVSAVRDASQVIVLDGGRVVERGTHATLIAAGGRYSALLQRQELEEEVEAAG